MKENSKRVEKLKIDKEVLKEIRGLNLSKINKEDYNSLFNEMENIWQKEYKKKNTKV